MRKERIDRVMKYYGDFVGTRTQARKILKDERDKVNIRKECSAILKELGYESCELMRGDKFV